MLTGAARKYVGEINALFTWDYIRHLDTIRSLKLWSKNEDFYEA